MIKLIATDIDGTILGFDKHFTPEVRECIKTLDENGVKVVLVTGRMNAAAQIIANDLNLKTPVVSYQGGLVIEKGKTLYERYLTKAEAEVIIEWGRNERVHLNLYNDDILYSETECEEVKKYADYQKIDYVVKPFDEIDKNKVNKLLAIDYNDSKRIDKYEKELPKLFPDLYIVKSTSYFLEFSNPEGSKYSAVKFLQQYWNLKDDEILTIGDQNNDIALLQAGGIKVAMGNATDELKSVADWVTDSVDNNGFVKAVEKYCHI